MVRAMQLVVLLGVGAAIGAIMTSKSETTFTTDRGITVVLKSDSTWEYKAEGKEAISQDVIEELGDGRILILRADGTWGFMEKNARTKTIMLGLKSVEASAISINKEHDVALKAAVQEVLDKLARKINTPLYKGQKSQQKIIDCIKEGAKDFTPVEKFTEAKTWQVTIEVKMYQDQIVDVADCIAKKEADAKAAADSIKALKSAKGKPAGKAATAPAGQ
jgi:hypothetical protein